MTAAAPIPTASTNPVVGSRLEKWFPYALTGAFFIVNVIQVWNHIMWRDEVRTWQVCAPCTGLISLWQAMRYEGVPVLWYYIVFALTRITSNPFSMQLVHAMIATATVFVVAKWAPFPIWTRAIFAVGYYPLFEYAAITRNYALVFLFLMIACVLISKPKVNLLVLSGVMLLLTQVSIWGAGLAGLMMLAGIAKSMLVHKDSRPPVWRAFAAGSIVLAGVALCLIEVRPGPGPSFTATWQNATVPQRLIGAFTPVFRGWIPIPKWSENFWNTNFLDLGVVFGASGFSIGYAVQGFLGILLFIVVALMLLRRPIALAALVLGVGALLGFEFIFKGVARHHGHVFIMLIVAMWLAETTLEWQRGRIGSDRIIGWFSRARPLALLVLLALSAIGGIGAASAGMFLPFSASRATADFIQKNYSDPKYLLAGVWDYCCSPIAQWLGRDIYFPQSHGFARYNTQNGDEKVRSAGVNFEDTVKEIVTVLMAQPNKEVVFILTSGPALEAQDISFVWNGKPHVLSIRGVGAFARSVVQDEQANVYHIRVIPASSSDFHL